VRAGERMNWWSSPYSSPSERGESLDRHPSGSPLETTTGRTTLGPRPVRGPGKRAPTRLRRQ
jgi:hypothetical protein